MKKNLVLIGMMGSGKSTIGRIIAKNVKKKFYDLDKIIENENNMSISEIFKRKGENFFRNYEEKVTIKTLKSSDSIIALGGGAFLNSKIREELKIQSITIWLKWSPNFLIPRIINSKTRPVVNKLNEEDLLKLVDARSKIYSKANFKINCDKLNKNNIMKKILEIYKNEKNYSKNQTK
tara:strand:+ start:45 stop:578 length:534 start_codon:yes stop_codon:yes gene_type:complete